MEKSFGKTLVFVFVSVWFLGSVAEGASGYFGEEERKASHGVVLGGGGGPNLYPPKDRACKKVRKRKGRKTQRSVPKKETVIPSSKDSGSKDQVQLLEDKIKEKKTKHQDLYKGAMETFFTKDKVPGLKRSIQEAVERGEILDAIETMELEKEEKSTKYSRNIFATNLFRKDVLVPKMPKPSLEKLTKSALEVLSRKSKGIRK